MQYAVLDKDLQFSRSFVWKKKENYLELQLKQGLLFFSDILHTCSPYQCLHYKSVCRNFFSLFCCVDVNKKRETWFRKACRNQTFLHFAWYLLYKKPQKTKTKKLHTFWPGLLSRIVFLSPTYTRSQTKQWPGTICRELTSACSQWWNRTRYLWCPSLPS